MAALKGRAGAQQKGAHATPAGGASASAPAAKPREASDSAAPKQLRSSVWYYVASKCAFIKYLAS